MCTSIARHLARADDLVLIDVGVELHAGAAIEVALLVERVAHALNHAAVDLALGQLRVDRPAAVVHRDDALDLDDAGLGVDRDLGELHAADAVLADAQIAGVDIM